MLGEKMPSLKKDFIIFRQYNKLVLVFQEYGLYDTW